MKALIAFAAICCLFGVSCHESLPPRADPGNIFSGKIQPRYVLNKTENDIWLCVTITNIFDETFQEKMLLQGSISIALFGDTSYSKTFALADTDLIRGRYDPRTKILTIDPDSSILLHLHWDMIDDHGRDVRKALTFDEDPHCTYRLIAKPTFYIAGQVKLIDHTREVIFGPLFYNVTMANTLVDPHVCPLVSEDYPCY